VDHCSDYLFAPTENAKENLLKEGISVDKIVVTGNTIVDALYQNLEMAKRKTDILSKLNLEKQEYFLATAHRQENVDVRERLKGILDGLELIYHEFNVPIIYPIHPRTVKRIKNFGLEVPKGVELGRFRRSSGGNLYFESALCYVEGDYRKTRNVEGWKQHFGRNK
jgi:UDP-N-acetylglucosamine 2-epimerase (non-hydrolysing)